MSATMQGRRSDFFGARCPAVHVSVFYVKCPTCGQTYLAGMVGAIPWPTHVCTNPRPNHIGVQVYKP